MSQVVDKLLEFWFEWHPEKVVNLVGLCQRGFGEVLVNNKMVSSL